TAGVIVLEIVGVVVSHDFGVDVTRGQVPHPASYSNTAELGRVLYTQFAYPFELAAVVLLVAIVAAISLTMRKRAGHKAQDVSRQVAVRAKDRVRIVHMEPQVREDPQGHPQPQAPVGPGERP
ncbi:MAG: NADH-quinone oxidoreductase subunit J, partial [Steroidobacteraceae bacterium]